jgi:hypothetical protein
MIDGGRFAPDEPLDASIASGPSASFAENQNDES